MAASSSTTVFSVKESWAYPLLQDREGEKPVYGRGIRIRGIQNISKTENLTIVNCPGDGTNIDAQSEIDSIEMSIEYGKMSHELDCLIKGGLHRLLTNESQHILGGSDQGRKFCLKFRATKLGVPGADYILSIWSVVAGTNARSNANKEFQTNSFDAQASQIAGKVLHPEANDWYLEQVRSSNIVEPINPATPFPALPASLTPLTLTGQTPAEAAVDVLPSENVTFTFSGPVDANYVTSDYFYIVAGDGSGIVPAAVSQSTNTVTINPTADLSDGKSYAAIVEPSVASGGVALNRSVVVNFTVDAP